MILRVVLTLDSVVPSADASSLSSSELIAQWNVLRNDDVNIANIFAAGSPFDFIPSNIFNAFRMSPSSNADASR